MMDSRPYQKAFTTNQSATAFTAKIVTFTRPSGNGVLDLTTYRLGGEVPCSMRLFPYGLGADNDVFSLRVWSWNKLGSGDRPNCVWIPSILGEFVCTISTFVGLVGAPVLNTERFADTLSIVATVGEPVTIADTTNAGTTIIYSPANNTPAWVEIETRGAQLLEFDTDETTNTPEANCLVQFLS